jgi:hypothetical protein
MQQIEIDRRDLIRYGGTGLLTAVILALLVGLGFALLRGKNPADVAFQDMRRMPLVAQVMADQPGVEDRMRQAIEDEIRSPTQGGGLIRPYVLLADLRRQYIVPALRRADDASAIAAVAARAALVAHLHLTDNPACRQFALGTLVRPDALDAEGRRLFEAWRQGLEAAYRAGKAASQPPPLPGRGRRRRDAAGGGLPQVRLRPPEQPSSCCRTKASCEVELKVDSVPRSLPPEKRGPFARYLLTN